MKKRLECILLVDDNEADNNFHRTIIEEADVANKIEVVENGEEAIAYLCNKANAVPELIFLDINMPRMNGWEFLDAYKKLPPEKKTRVIVMLTTSQNPEDRQRASTIAEIAGFRTKPITAEDVRSIVENCFGDSNCNELEADVKKVF